MALARLAICPSCGETTTTKAQPRTLILCAAGCGQKFRAPGLPDPVAAEPYVAPPSADDLPAGATVATATRIPQRARPRDGGASRGAGPTVPEEPAPALEAEVVVVDDPPPLPPIDAQESGRRGGRARPGAGVGVYRRRTGGASRVRS